jgi:hypothetical protein
VTKRPLESQPGLGRIRASGLPTGNVPRPCARVPAGDSELGESRRGRAVHRDEAKEGKNCSESRFLWDGTAGTLAKKLAHLHVGCQRCRMIELATCLSAAPQLGEQIASNAR